MPPPLERIRHGTCPKSSLWKTCSARPSARAATISPDGTKIAYLAPWQNRLNVWVQSVDSDDEPGV